MSNDLPLVSVVIPARNEERSIRDAIQSVAKQRYPVGSLEVVVVDGDSTDGTVAEATAAADGAGFHRFEVVPNPDAATPSNLNRGLAWAEGEILVRVDARSRIPDDYVSTLVDVLSTRPDVSVCGGSQVAIERSDRLVHRAIARALNNRLGMGGARYRRPGAASGPTDTAYLGVFRTDQLSEIGGWNPDYPTNQDFELNQRLARLGTVWFEAGLPVRYVPRATVGEIVRQYRRFGGWKVRYWRDGHRPRPRQVVLLVAPPLVAAGALGVAVTHGAAGVLVVAAVGTAGALAIDVAGAAAPADLGVRMAAGSINLLIGAAWFSGVASAALGAAAERLTR